MKVFPAPATPITTITRTALLVVPLVASLTPERTQAASLPTRVRILHYPDNNDLDARSHRSAGRP